MVHYVCVITATPFGTYQLEWHDGRARLDLVRKDRLKEVRVLEGETLKLAWYITSSIRAEGTDMKKIRRVVES